MGLTVGLGKALPNWCEAAEFGIHDLAGSEVSIPATHRSGRVLATGGSVQAAQGARSQVLREGQFFDYAAGESVVLRGTSGQPVHFAGDWGSELGGCGVFRASNVDSPSDRGDPVSYPKHTNVDSHYHDCDEYWLLLEGRATVVVDGEHAEMRPGDCLPIAMGLHHDMPTAPEPVKAVYFEATLRGLKRIGHLWTHTHGRPTRPEEHSS
jgi:mannose-6-phosphate isomerase-like protein (cupin superfamily)